MKILISSNGAHTPTGYGTQTKYLSRALRQMGHEVGIFAWYGLAGRVLQIGGMTTYPRIDHAWGGDAGVPAKNFGADLLITLQDVWVLPADFADTLPCPWLAWYPVDGDPMPPLVKARAETADYPVTYSKFGQASAIKEGLPSYYIPHGIDTAVFSPVSAAERQALRQRSGLSDDTFMVTMVAANKGFPSRKSFPEAMAAFAAFHKRHPNSLLYIHAEADAKSGMDLRYVQEMLGLEETAVVFPNPDELSIGFGDEQVANLYRMSDVLLSPSMGEGFGLPIAEAQACGLPVITQDCTSMSELTVNGIAVPPLQKHLTGQYHYQYTADIEEVDWALESIYDWSDGTRAEMAEAGIAHIRNYYDWSVVGHMWQSFLFEIEARAQLAEVTA